MVGDGEVLGLLTGHQVILQSGVVGDGGVEYTLHQGDGGLQTVQLVHSYNLPPSQEKAQDEEQQQTVVEQLLLQAAEAPIQTVVSFKKTVFLDHLKQYYMDCQFADTTVICADQTR